MVSLKFHSSSGITGFFKFTFKINCFDLSTGIESNNGVNKHTHNILYRAIINTIMKICIVNGYQLLCCAYTVLERHRETAALFLVYSLSSFSAFSFCLFVTLTVIFLFLRASILCVNNLNRLEDLVLWFPDRIAVCTHPWYLLVFLTLKKNYNNFSCKNNPLI